MHIVNQARFECINSFYAPFLSPGPPKTVSSLSPATTQSFPTSAQTARLRASPPISPAPPSCPRPSRGKRWTCNES